jgi:hypothetical protein
VSERAFPRGDTPRRGTLWRLQRLHPKQNWAAEPAPSCSAGACTGMTIAGSSGACGTGTTGAAVGLSAMRSVCRCCSVIADKIVQPPLSNTTAVAGTA